MREGSTSSPAIPPWFARSPRPWHISPLCAWHSWSRIDHARAEKTIHAFIHPCHTRKHLHIHPVLNETGTRGGHPLISRVHHGHRINHRINFVVDRWVIAAPVGKSGLDAGARVRVAPTGY